MVKDEGLHKLGKTKLDLAFDVFFSLTAFFVLSLSFYYWLRLVGVWNVENWRFDLMDWHWRVLVTFLAVFYPVAACGLWQQAGWGIVLWLSGALSESLCLTFFSAYFAFNLFVPSLHLLLLFFYAFLTLYRHQNMKKENTEITYY